MFIPEAHNQIHFGACVMKCLGLRIGDCHAESAADHGTAVNPFGLCRFAKRSDKVKEAVPFIQHIKLFSRISDLLEYNCNCSLFPVIAGDREGNPFPFFIDPEDNELPGHCLPGNQRRLDLHQGHRFIEYAFFYDRIHNDSSKYTDTEYFTLFILLSQLVFGFPSYSFRTAFRLSGKDFFTHFPFHPYAPVI